MERQSPEQAVELEEIEFQDVTTVVSPVQPLSEAPLIDSVQQSMPSKTYIGPDDTECPICHDTLAQIKERIRTNNLAIHLTEDQMLSEHVEACTDWYDKCDDLEIEEATEAKLQEPQLPVEHKELTVLPAYVTDYSLESIQEQIAALESIGTANELNTKLRFPDILNTGLTDVSVFHASIADTVTDDERLAAEENMVFAMHQAQKEYFMLEQILSTRRIQREVQEPAQPRWKRGKNGVKRQKIKPAHNPLEPEDPVVWGDKKEADLYGYVYDPVKEKRGKQDPIAQQANKYSIRGRELRSRNRNYELKTVHGYEYRDPRTANMEPKLTRRRKQNEDKDKPGSRDASTPAQNIPAAGSNTAASRSGASTPVVEGQLPIKRKPGRPRGSGVFNINNQVPPPLIKTKSVDGIPRHPLSQAQNANMPSLDGLAVLSTLNNSSSNRHLEPMPSQGFLTPQVHNTTRLANSHISKLKYGDANRGRVQDIISRPGTATPSRITPPPQIGPISQSAPVSPNRFYHPPGLGHSLRPNHAPILTPEVMASAAETSSESDGESDSDSPPPTRGRGRGGRPRGRGRGTRGRPRGSRGPGRPRGSRASRTGVPIVPHVAAKVEAETAAEAESAHALALPNGFDFSFTPSQGNGTAIGGDTTEAEADRNASAANIRPPSLNLTIPQPGATPSEARSTISPTGSVDTLTGHPRVRGRIYKTPTSVSVDSSDLKATMEQEFAAVQNTELGKRKRTKAIVYDPPYPTKRKRRIGSIATDDGDSMSVFTASQGSVEPPVSQASRTSVGPVPSTQKCKDSVVGEMDSETMGTLENGGDSVQVEAVPSPI